MAYLESLEESTPQQYRIKIMTELLMQANISGLDLNEFVGFFGAQVQAMLASPPNYNKYGQKARVWYMRGFYPGSSIFFKLVLCTRDSSYGGASYYAKVSPLRIEKRVTKNRIVEDNYQFDGSEISEDVTNRMENTFFGADHELKPLVPNKIKMPRCMSPKGMKIFRYEPLRGKG